MWSRKVSPAWSRYFGLADQSASFAPTVPPPSVPEQRLRTLAAHLPSGCRTLLISELRLALRLHQHRGWRDEQEPASPPFSRQRFGLHGEELLGLARDELLQRLKRECREALRTLEAPEETLCRTMRNWQLATHCAHRPVVSRTGAPPARPACRPGTAQNARRHSGYLIQFQLLAGTVFAIALAKAARGYYRVRSG